LIDLPVTLRIHQTDGSVERREFPSAQSLEDWLKRRPLPWSADTPNYEPGAVGCWRWAPDGGRVVDYWPGDVCSNQSHRSALGSTVLRVTRRRLDE